MGIFKFNNLLLDAIPAVQQSQKRHKKHKHKKHKRKRLNHDTDIVVDSQKKMIRVRSRKEDDKVYVSNYVKKKFHFLCLNFN